MEEIASLKELKDMKSVLERKVTNYFGSDKPNIKDVGYQCLVEQIKNIDKYIIEKQSDNVKEIICDTF